MRIFFYAPLKPLNHANPSGDLVIARDLYSFLAEQGHRMTPVSSLRTRWIYWKPWLWPVVVRDVSLAERRVQELKPHIWLTYHSYYKAPDLLGPMICRRFNLPYVILEASYATNKKKRLKSKPGFYLNQQTLLAADHIFTNRWDDYVNLKRLRAECRLSNIPPGIHPENFTFNPYSRANIRNVLEIPDDARVVATAAMFRPGVKTKGLSWVIKACGRLVREGLDLILLIVGDGREKETLKRQAADELGDKVRFAGKAPRSEMHRFYSAGDVFAFPGFEEAIGMVYLEAQSCGLPVAAMNDGGVSEVVKDGATGLLSPCNDFDAFTDNIGLLLNDTELRNKMSERAAAYVRERHDLKKNYTDVECVLSRLAKEKRESKRTGVGS